MTRRTSPRVGTRRPSRADAWPLWFVFVSACAGTCGSLEEREPDPDAPLEVRHEAPPDAREAMTIRVTAWPPHSWSVFYPNRTTDHRLVLPVGEWTELEIASTSFASDDTLPPRSLLHLPEVGWTLAVPRGAAIRRWVRPRRPFGDTSRCVEHCGPGPQRPPFSVEAREPSAYQAYLESRLRPPDGMSAAQWGAQLVSSNGCLTCHGGLTASLEGLWNEPREMPDATPIVVRGEAGRRYVRAWIASPREGGEVPMPAFSLPDEHADAIAAFMRCGDVAECPDEPPGEPEGPVEEGTLLEQPGHPRQPSQ